MPLRAAANSTWRKTKKRMAGSCWKEGMRGWSSCVFVDEYVAAYDYVCIAGGVEADGDISHPQATVTWHL
jgi:hypothetical protein